jgi:hypothetical protein
MEETVRFHGREQVKKRTEHFHPSIKERNGKLEALPWKRESSGFPWKRTERTMKEHIKVLKK